MHLCIKLGLYRVIFGKYISLNSVLVMNKNQKCFCAFSSASSFLLFFLCFVLGCPAVVLGSAVPSTLTGSAGLLQGAGILGILAPGLRAVQM